MQVKPFHISQIINLLLQILDSSALISVAEAAGLFTGIGHLLNAIVRYHRDSLIHVIPHLFNLLQNLLM